MSGIDPQQIGVAIGAIVVALVWVARRLGWLRDRTPSQEPRAEEMWRSEAEAQKSRGDRLEDELKLMRIEMDRMKQEIAALTALPDLTDVLRRFDEHQELMLARHEQLADVLSKIAQAVIPPGRVRD